MALRSCGRRASSRLLVRTRQSTSATLSEIPSGNRLCHARLANLHQTAIKLSFSTAKSDFSPFSWFRNRQEEKNAQKYREQMEQMSNKEVWTLADMNDGVEETTKSWLAKIPVLNNNKEMEMATRLQKVLNGVMQVAGRDATIDDLENLGRADKLRAALAGETTAEEVNGLILQFEAMSLMHRVVRKRRLEGKPIPQTIEAMEAVVQVEGPKLLNKKQKARIGKRAAQNMMRKARRR